MEILTILLVLALGNVLAVNYCDPKMCPYQPLPHIACNNTGEFSKNCTGNYTLIDMKPYQSLILREHNVYRNVLAGGDLKCFYPASRMAALEWNSELAYFASLNVKTCKFGHDNCRATATFYYAGQNIYYCKTKNFTATPDLYIKEAHLLWFGEYRYANASLMEKFEITKPQTGHFTTLTSDRQTHVGCAFLENYIIGNWRVLIFTCDYSSTNFIDYPTYRAGRTATRCPEKHPIYDSLCTTTGIDPNDLSFYRK